jgi:hypothetical protein
MANTTADAGSLLQSPWPPGRQDTLLVRLTDTPSRSLPLWSLSESLIQHHEERSVACGALGAMGSDARLLAAWWS